MVQTKRCIYSAFYYTVVYCKDWNRSGGRWERGLKYYNGYSITKRFLVKLQKSITFLRKTGSDISTTLIQGFNFTNSRFQLHEFTISTSRIHEFNFTNSRIQLQEFHFTNSTSRIHEFNFTNSRIQLHEFTNSTARIHEFNFMNSRIQLHEFHFTNSTSRIHEFNFTNSTS